MIPNKNNTQYTKRSPIITVAGHIDHGKTTLLNYLKKSKKIRKEHGNITQYIKPHIIKTKYGNITFLDTPGHFAFNAIRKKCIQYSDIVIIIIAIDDGVKPQTIETIDIAQKFNTPIIVAINKVDKSNKKNEKIITELSKYNLTPEKWGGDTLVAFISAKTGEGIDNLIELINLQADMLDLKSTINTPTNGIILDNKIDKQKGAIATVITLNGYLKKNDIIQINNKFGKIRTIYNELGKEITEHYITQPLYITGLPNIIEIGEKFHVTNKIKNINIINKDTAQNKKQYNIKELIKNIKTTQKLTINIILKTDVQGSINVLKETIKKIQENKININIIKIELGDFKKSDIDLANTTKAILIGFNVKCDSITKKLAENLKIKINIFNIIYDIIDYIKDILEKKLADENKENIIGIANVKKIFTQDKITTIAGCIVTHGKIKQNSKIQILRKNTLIYKGQIESIKTFKTNINEIKAGNECGISIKNYNNIQINDKIQALT